jgi:hypothetical protein
MEESPPGLPQERVAQNLNRSCEACRGRKVRCLQQTIDPSSTQCARCQKMSLNCIFLAPSTRQRRKRTDIRIAELEKELKLMQKRLGGNKSESCVVRKGTIVFEPECIDLL